MSNPLKTCHLFAKIVSSNSSIYKICKCLLDISILEILSRSNIHFKIIVKIIFK